MLFNSVLYLLFLPAVAVLFHLSPRGARRMLLLVASYTFYWVWSVPFSGLLVLSTVVDYLASRVIDRPGASAAIRRLGLVVSLTANLGVLALFKYVDFFTSSINSVFGAEMIPGIDLVLPLGISFYTFQTMSYTIDVYRREMPACKSLLDVALYVSFFPQLVAGPIIRAGVLIPQLQQARAIDWPHLRAGVGFVIWGMLKKVYVADAMAPIVNEAYGDPGVMSGWALLQATYAFAVQIYCDFSGYTDIAIGSAMILGIRLPENFRTPYLSCSIREFWRRWHISLSTWLRDYLYIPLGGSRKGPTRTQANLMVTMLLGGLWHGAGWNWVVWGGLQGLMMVVERALGLSEDRPRRLVVVAVRWFVTLHLVCLSWVFFRADGVREAFEIVGRITTFASGEVYFATTPMLVFALLVVFEVMGVRHKAIAWLKASEAATLWIGLAAAAVLALTFRGASNPEFIYFQF